MNSNFTITDEEVLKFKSYAQQVGFTPTELVDYFSTARKQWDEENRSLMAFVKEHFGTNKAYQPKVSPVSKSVKNSDDQYVRDYVRQDKIEHLEHFQILANAICSFAKGRYGKSFTINWSRLKSSAILHGIVIDDQQEWLISLLDRLPVTLDWTPFIYARASHEDSIILSRGIIELFGSYLPPLLACYLVSIGAISGGVFSYHPSVECISRSEVFTFEQTAIGLVEIAKWFVDSSCLMTQDQLQKCHLMQEAFKYSTGPIRFIEAFISKAARDFIILHELSHLLLTGSISSQNQKLEELDADALAMNTLIHKNDLLALNYSNTNREDLLVYCFIVPVFVLLFESLIEKMIQEKESGTHPPGLFRAENLRKGTMLSLGADPPSMNVYSVIAYELFALFGCAYKKAGIKQTFFESLDLDYIKDYEFPVYPFDFRKGIEIDENNPLFPLLFRTKECSQCHMEAPLLINRCYSCGFRVFKLSPDIDTELLNRVQSEAQVHVDQGALLCQRGLYKEAECELLRAIELNPCNATAYGNMAVVKLRSGELQAAINWVQRSLRINPRIEGGKQLLEQIKLRLSTAPGGCDL